MTTDMDRWISLDDGLMHGFTRWIVGDSRSVISNDARERVESKK